MKLLAKLTISVIAAASFITVSHAASYQIQSISYIYADTSGRVLIKWAGSPNPGPCGSNNGWVAIKSTANEAIKTLAYTIYFSGKPARIDTAGCDGSNESVGSLYSPGG